MNISGSDHVSLALDGRGISNRVGESGCHFKLVLLFRTLHQRPELCGLIKKLGKLAKVQKCRFHQLTRSVDVRFFPLAARGGERLDLDDQVRTAVNNMTALESLVWTASHRSCGM